MVQACGGLACLGGAGRPGQFRAVFLFDFAILVSDNKNCARWCRNSTKTAPLVEGAMRRANRNNLRKLKGLLERREG